MKLSDYIIPIGSPCEGCGIFVDNYFITAGHVLELHEDTAIYFRNEKFLLSKKAPKGFVIQ